MLRQGVTDDRTRAEYDDSFPQSAEAAERFLRTLIPQELEGYIEGSLLRDFARPFTYAHLLLYIPDEMREWVEHQFATPDVDFRVRLPSDIEGLSITLNKLADSQRLGGIEQDLISRGADFVEEVERWWIQRKDIAESSIRRRTAPGEEPEPTDIEWVDLLNGLVNLVSYVSPAMQDVTQVFRQERRIP